MKLDKKAIALLRRVKRHILAEPKRADMNCYINHQSMKNGGPRCGMVGCIAGWVVLLSVPRNRWNEIIRADLVRDISIREKAEELLGLKPFGAASNRLFSSRTATQPQTPEHTKEIAQRIDRFIENYR